MPQPEVGRLQALVPPLLALADPQPQTRQSMQALTGQLMELQELLRALPESPDELGAFSGWVGPGSIAFMQG